VEIVDGQVMLVVAAVELRTSKIEWLTPAHVESWTLAHVDGWTLAYIESLTPAHVECWTLAHVDCLLDMGCGISRVKGGGRGGTSSRTSLFISSSSATIISASTCLAGCFAFLFFCGNLLFMKESLQGRLIIPCESNSLVSS